LPHASPKSTNLNAGVVDQGVEAEALKVRLDDLTGRRSGSLMSCS
jgi:hypothetical protein